MNLQESIRISLEKAVETVAGRHVEVALEHPRLSAHGDFTTNVALLLGGNPREVAEKILAVWEKPSVVVSADIAGPGFINIRLSERALLDSLKEAFRLGEHFGKSQSFRKKKVIIEYTDQNPFKEMHVGHLYSNIIGESISRLFEAGEADVRRAIYQGDIGLHVAKAVWGMRVLMEEQKLGLEELDQKESRERVAFLGKAYVLGATRFEDDKNVQEEITRLNKKIYERDKEVKEIYETGRKWSLEDFERMYARLGTKFDFYYLESGMSHKGINIVRENLKKGVFEESDNAIIFPGEKVGLHTRVFINSLGLPTYEAKELALAPTKYKDFPYDVSIIVTGNDIIEYFKVILKALEKIDPELAGKTRHIGHGMIRLPEGKMSSRTGNVLTAEWLLDEAKKRLTATYQEMEKETADKVAVGAIKYALLKVSIGQDVSFSFEKSLNFEGDSGPYIQYTHARTQSVLANSKQKTQNAKLNVKIKLNDEELAILRYFYRFPEVVQQATESFTPNILCTFLFDLAQRYNAFYNKHRIVDAENTSREFRLLLTSVVGTILKNGLWLLGIQAPTKL
ncbi:MAG: arginine--tRNA ligase [bacterium]|nr:arginine--tRNA ligase [bacterium]